ncbi:uncharacterized protein [Nicotiana tomentosiformis]|uniref:uncharacterized protein n=1 Tax=Nicotiana tomentosiformis TaxID=4098 RepID=UPI00051B9704|nr:uncharacterized protein LOC104094334 [Nicotiana tomentosiformis]
MDADERLTALKRAYADIILNTAKEAAARIMSSEQKAVRYKQELKVAKEEALGMLLRLKQMMDSKISEAELTSLSQQRKIEELEAQLQEAEDIVNDLRVDLREVQAELERVTSSEEKEVQNLGKDDTATPVELPEENIVVLPPESQKEFLTISDTKAPNMKQNNQGNQSCSKMVQIGKPYVAGPDLPSIILRSKVPELYRNGCTQRIRACEGNLLDGDISVSKRENENGDGIDEGERICSAPNHKVDDAVNPEEEFQQADDLLSSWHLLKSFRRKRRRAVRNRKVDYSSPTSSSDHFLNVDKTSNTGGLRAHSSTAGDCPPDEDPSQVGQSLSIEKAEPDMKLGLTEMDGTELQSAETSGVLNATVRDELVMAKIDPPRQGSRYLESLEVPVYRTDLENISRQLFNSESKTSDANDEVPSQTVNDRVIKYTFQRKRKRESLSVLEENAPIEKISSKEINGEKQNDLEPNMSSSVTESSRDSRRVAQVARQLISLSEKKWWQ